MKSQPAISRSADVYQEPVIIYHSRKGAITFSTAILGLGIATIAAYLYLSNQPSNIGPVPIPIVVGFVCIFSVGFHVAKHLLQDAGKVAITLGSEGVKFDRYPLIKWSDIDKVYVVEDSDGPSSLCLSVKKGVTFLPDGPRPFIWLARVTGLHRNIDISGYGSLSMSDDEIRKLLEQGLQYIEE